MRLHLILWRPRSSRDLPKYPLIGKCAFDFLQDQKTGDGLAVSQKDESTYLNTFRVVRNHDGKKVRIDDVYAIDYRATRVGFHSQQLRALDLAVALLERKPPCLGDYDKEQTRFAIIGGGVAGTTLYAAMLSLGARNVHLFEAGRKLMAVQAKSTHRFAHPSYNDWPLHDNFNSTTNLPFLNWHGWTADCVVEQLCEDEQFFSLRQRNIEGSRVNLETYVTRILEDTAGSGRKYRLELRPNRPGGKTFDVVIFAAGFDHEVNLELSRSPSYWWSDNIYSFCAERHRYAEMTKYVSGTGDGGLIDAARIGFGPDLCPFTPIRMISALRDRKFRIMPTDLDNEEAQPASEFETRYSELLGKEHQDGFKANLHGIIEQLLGFDEPGQSNDWSSKDWEAARTFVKKLLQRRDNERQRVSLVGKPAEFTVDDSVSPINGLIFCLLLLAADRNGNPIDNLWADYRQGEVTGLDPNKPEEHGPRLIVRHPGSTTTKEEIPLPSADRLVFLRHGPGDGTLKKLLGELAGKGEKWRADRETDLNMNPGQYSAKFHNLMFSGVFASGNADPEDSADLTRLDYRGKLVSRLSKRAFEEAQVSLKDAKDPTTFEIALPFSKNAGAYERLGGFDRQMYGANVVYRDTDTDDGAHFKADVRHRWEVHDAV